MAPSDRYGARQFWVEHDDADARFPCTTWHLIIVIDCLVYVCTSSLSLTCARLYGLCGGITAVRLGGCRCSTRCLINNPRTAHQRPTRTPTSTAHEANARACAKCPGSRMACANVLRICTAVACTCWRNYGRTGDVRRINGRVIARNGENRKFGVLRIFV